MTLIDCPSATRSCCHNGQSTFSKSKRLDENRNRRKNSNISLVSSCPCFENGCNRNIKNCRSVCKSWSNLKRRTSSGKVPILKENGVETANSRNKVDWCDCKNLPVFKVGSSKILCQPPCNKKIICRGKNVCIRRVPIIPKNQLKTSCAPLDKETTYKIDYPAKQTCPPKAIKHDSTLTKRCEPMISETTYKNSYQAKPYSKRKGFCPINEVIKSCEPMQGETMTMSDYKVPQGFVQTSSFRPDNSFHPSLHPFDDKTTYKTDYVPCNTRGPKGPYPWTPGNKYELPVVPMHGDTTYKTSYLYPEYFGKPKLIQQKEQGIGISGSPFDDSTTYKNDYQPCEIVNERDCYDANGSEICCNAPCDPANQRPCYKVDGMYPLYKNEQENTQPKVMNIPIRQHSVPILCC